MTRLATTTDPGPTARGTSAGLVVAVCSTRLAQFALSRTLFARSALAVRTATTAEALATLYRTEEVRLTVLDAMDPWLDFDGLLGVLTSGDAPRFRPVLAIARGERASIVRERLSGHLAVQVVDLAELPDLEAATGPLLGVPARRHVRVAFRARVRVEGTPPASGQSHDLSEEGMGVVLPDEVPTGRMVVTFRLPGDPQPVRTAAEVRRTAALAGGGVFVGLNFVELGEGDRERLRAYIDQSLVARMDEPAQ